MSKYIEDLAMKIYATLDTTQIDKGLREISARLKYFHNQWGVNLETASRQKLTWLSTKAKEIISLSRAFKDSDAFRRLSKKEKIDFNRAELVAKLFKKNVDTELKRRKKLVTESIRQDAKEAEFYRKAWGQNYEFDKRQRRQKQKEIERTNRIDERNAGYAALATIAFATRQVHKIISVAKEGITDFIAKGTETQRNAFQLGLPATRLQKYSKLLQIYGGDETKFFDSIRNLNTKIARIAVTPAGKNGKDQSGSRIAKVIQAMKLNVKGKRGLRGDLDILEQLITLLPRYSRNTQQGLLQMLGFDKGSQRIIMNMAEAMKKYGTELDKVAHTEEELKAAGDITEAKGLTSAYSTKFWGNLTKSIKPVILQIEKAKQSFYEKGTKDPVWASAATIGTLAGITYAFGKLALAIKTVGVAASATMALPSIGAIALAAGGAIGITSLLKKISGTSLEEKMSLSSKPTGVLGKHAYYLPDSKKAEYLNHYNKTHHAFTDTGVLPDYQYAQLVKAGTNAASAVAASNMASTMQYQKGTTIQKSQTDVDFNGGINITVNGELTRQGGQDAANAFINNVKEAGRSGALDIGYQSAIYTGQTN